MKGRSLAALVAFIAAVAGAYSAPATAATRVIRITTLSNRADLISDGDALVEIRGAGARGLRVTLNGRNVSAVFAPRPSMSGRIVGLIGGLRLGRNIVTARAPGVRGATLRITNHPAGGPIFAGPQVQPWVCDTTNLGLGPARDRQCNTPARYDYQYKSSTTGQYSAYDPKNPPGDVATTTTDQGVTVPFIVRHERGVIDRGVYDVTVLFDPSKGWTAVSPQRAWNHKALLANGAGCDAGHKQIAPQATNGIVGADDAALSRGFMTTITEMDDNTQDCNDVVQAEAVMMLKEHIIDAYGTIRYLISEGGSGGSMSQHSIAANYPGLIDAIQPSASFPDIWTTYQEMADCKILASYFDTRGAVLFTEQQRAWASGHASAGTCEFQSKARSNSYVSAYGNGTSTSSSAPCAGYSWTYDANTNPAGERCGIQDYERSIFGRRPQSAWGPVEKRIGRGFANRPYDNVGVQYGLEALEAGQILPEQFVDLNENVGGLDIDGNVQSARSVADPAALTTAYRTGRVTNLREDARIPIIDLRGSSNYEEHFDWHTYEFRNRLRRDTGTTANMVYWHGPCCLLTGVAFTVQAFDLMDRWLAAVERDKSGAPLEAKVRRDKPADAVDACWLGSVEITMQDVCDAAMPYYHETRWAAGGPDTADVIKCQLKPLRRDDYSSGGTNVAFTDGEWARLQQTFPDGVCDYTKPGVGQTVRFEPWLTFARGPGGSPLGAPPTSQPL